MENTRRTFALSLAAGLFAAWLYFGFPPFTDSFSPMAEGTVLNTLAKIVAIPLTLAIIGVGGLAAASALSCVTDVEATREADRRLLALTTPAGVVWVVFVAVMAFPLGPVGNAIVVCASVLAVMRIVQNAIALGVFQASPGSDPTRDCPQGGA